MNTASTLFSLVLSGLVYMKPLCVLVSSNVKPVAENLTSVTEARKGVGRCGKKSRRTMGRIRALIASCTMKIQPDS